MPEVMKQISLATPQAWSLVAYMQLLVNPAPNFLIIGEACLALLGFGAVFLTLAWWLMQLD